MENNICIFIHCALISGAESRLNSFLTIIEKSKLLESVSAVYISCVGDGPLPILYLSNTEHYNKLQIVRSSPKLTDFEVPTQQFLYDYCCKNPSAKVLYIHTKGVGKELNLCIEDWVYYMLYFLVEEWQTAVAYLGNYKTVGVDLREEPHLHYSGNFWWSNAKHISELPSPNDFKNIQKYPNLLNSERHNQEFWICFNQPKELHNSLYDCGINCYQRHLHRFPRRLYQQ